MSEQVSEQGKPPAHDEDVHYAMLLDFVTVEQGFHFAVGGYTDERYRNEVIARLKADAEDAGVQLVELDLYKVTEPDPVLLTLCREALEGAADDPRPKALSVIGVERHLSYQEGGGREKRTDLLPTANFQRDAFPKRCPAPLIVWANPLARNALMMVAPDLWHWRNGTFFFDTAREDGQPAKHAELIEAMLPRVEHPNFYFPKADGERRIALLRELLKPDADPPATGERRCYLLLDLAGALERAADYPGAEAVAKEAQGIAQSLRDEHLQATAWFQLGRLAFAGGVYDAALMIWQKEALPCWERLGDRRGAAVTRSMMASALIRIGELAEARSLLQNHVLPVWRELKDDVSLAVELGKLADVFIHEKQYDMALALLQDEQAPLLRKAGDRQGVAQVAYDVALVCYRLRLFDEAVHALTDEALPGFRYVGDRQGEAAALGLLGLNLRGQGRTAEALRLQKEEVLPLQQAIGAACDVATVRCNIAVALLSLDPQANREEAREHLCAARGYFAEQNLPQLQRIDALLAAHGLTCGEGGESPLPPGERVG
jgi:predicted negative regulator of RcsB-dependent stress response